MFYNSKMKRLQHTLREAFDQCGGADDGLDLNEFRIVLDVLQCGIDSRAATTIFKAMNKEARDGDDDAIMSGDAFAVMCVRHDVFPKTVVVRDNEQAPLNLQAALKRRGVAMANRQRRASANAATNKATTAASPAAETRRASV